MHKDEKINYVELSAQDMAATKQFFAEVFGWSFTDYGTEYSAFSRESAGLDGGFYPAGLTSPDSPSAGQSGALVVFYSEQLEWTMEKIISAGGKIVRPVFSFPGGQRFHFTAPCGNEYAVWSDNPTAQTD